MAEEPTTFEIECNDGEVVEFSIMTCYDSMYATPSIWALRSLVQKKRQTRLFVSTVWFFCTLMFFFPQNTTNKTTKQQTCFFKEESQILSLVIGGSMHIHMLSCNNNFCVLCHILFSTLVVLYV